MAYLFDTNILIRSKNEMPLDIWPTFWGKMEYLINSGCIFTSIKVKEEINKQEDELLEWLTNHTPKDFYIPIDNDILNVYGDIQRWASSLNRFTSSALNDFAEVADAYLVATASVKGLVLVTNEVPAPQSKKRVKIPDVCDVFGVRYCDLNTVLRETRTMI